MTSKRPSFHTAWTNSRIVRLLSSLTRSTRRRIPATGRRHEGGSPRVSPRVSAVGAPPRSVYRRLVGMVGAPLERERELGTLREGLDRAGGGEGEQVRVGGPAGVGKSELVREARGVAGRRGVLAAEATGSELERA